METKLRKRSLVLTFTPVILLAALSAAAAAGSSAQPTGRESPARKSAPPVKDLGTGASTAHRLRQQAIRHVPLDRLDLQGKAITPGSKIRLPSGKSIDA